ncbi:MAG: phosphatidylserine decarboxylase family protein [Bacteroidales bacterium]|nr:phosphatidylserine decarboxylase family protein [Bacteroidales bacterium]
MIEFLLLIETVIISTIMYLYLIHKTKINKKFLFIDNIIVITFSFALTFILYLSTKFNYSVLYFLIAGLLVITDGFALTMIRFWRTPNRKLKAKENELISPADGNIIYIKRIEKGETPISIKNGLSITLNELTKTTLLNSPCWLIGINMTPFDVHKNCSPIEGEVILNEHFDGKFLSLKNTDALTQNERQTIVIKNNVSKIGIVQTASRLVRRIDSYVKKGDIIKKGEWYGMIRFGSQVDLIIPIDYTVNVNLKQQVYAVKTIIAFKN